MANLNLPNLHSKKLGVLIKAARIKTHRTIQDCGTALGITPGNFRAYEEGYRSPSLPELEYLAFLFDLPIHYFLGGQLVDDVDPARTLTDIASLTMIRQRMIGAQIRSLRTDTGISVKSMAEQTSLSTSRLRSYELGEQAIPFPILEELIRMLNGNLEAFLSQRGPVGDWIAQKQTLEDFKTLPNELQAFVTKPINRPYLELARSLSGLSAEKLRSVAENLLDITL